LRLYILDTQGRVAASFERLHWEESQAVDRSAEVLREAVIYPLAALPSVATIFATLASLAWPFFPKCPMC
jgi:hypothetical protein